MTKKLVRVKIKWPEATPSTSYIKFRHYTQLKRMVDNDLSRFNWHDTGTYFPDYILLQEEDALIYTLAN